MLFRKEVTLQERTEGAFNIRMQGSFVLEAETYLVFSVRPAQKNTREQIGIVMLRALKAQTRPQVFLNTYFRNHEGLAAVAAKLLQSCPTLCDPRDGSPPGSAVHGIFQARVLEWGAIAFSMK